MEGFYLELKNLPARFLVQADWCWQYGKWKDAGVNLREVQPMFQRGRCLVSIWRNLIGPSSSQAKVSGVFVGWTSKTNWMGRCGVATRVAVSWGLQVASAGDGRPKICLDLALVKQVKDAPKRKVVSWSANLERTALLTASKPIVVRMSLLMRSL